MNNLPLLTISIAIIGILAPAFAEDPANWKPLFDGKSLRGWDGDPNFWKVEEGAITGTTTEQNPTKGNTFIIFTGENTNHEPAEFGDFELKLKFRIEGHNSGIQYRSFRAEGGPDRWRVGGYQSDFDAAGNWAGTNYGERFRGILAKRGEKVVLTGTEEVEDKKSGRKKTVVKREVSSLGDPAELVKHVKIWPEWNEMHIIAKGHTLVQKINDVVMSEVTDNDKENRRDKGLIAVQLHGGSPMKVQVKEVKVKE